MSETTILDANGVKLIVGARVGFGTGPAEGTVTQLTDPDADHDGERYVALGPYVYVKYDDEETEDRFTAQWTATGPWDEDAPFQCDDVVVVNEEGS